MSVRESFMCLFLALPSLAGAQTMDPATKELIERLLTRIDTLERRVAQLENPRQAATAPTTPAAPAPAATPAVQAGHEHDAAPLPDSERPSYPLLKVAGFSDFNFAATDLRGA